MVGPLHIVVVGGSIGGLPQLACCETLVMMSIYMNGRQSSFNNGEQALDFCPQRTATSRIEQA